VDGGNLLLFGASTRAAAFSARRAGLRPRCYDLFADADLQARCPVTRLAGRYPHGFLDHIDDDPPGPWMYSGGLENWPGLVDRMARRRRLWGNCGDILRRVRAPQEWTRVVRAAGLPAPESRAGGAHPAGRGRWLLKPLRGSGGAKIRFWDHEGVIDRGYFLQEYVEGEPWAALFAADGGRATLLGVTRQLVGEPWLHAAPFQYCGSVGPLSPGPVLRPRLELLGNVLTGSFGLCGLFGVDGVVRGGDFFPVEINPRYTASVEVLERATGLGALAWHRQAFDPPSPTPSLPRPGPMVGKAILFARNALTFPARGPWQAELCETDTHPVTPRYADLPHTGDRIEAGRPVLTFFGQGDDPVTCLHGLRQTAVELDRLLFGR
jgi:predicted ATP-grasp superfamily ATP-dependent carboligase